MSTTDDGKSYPGNLTDWRTKRELADSLTGALDADDSNEKHTAAVCAVIDAGFAELANMLNQLTYLYKKGGR